MNTQQSKFTVIISSEPLKLPAISVKHTDQILGPDTYYLSNITHHEQFLEAVERFKEYALNYACQLQKLDNLVTRAVFRVVLELEHSQEQADVYFTRR